MNKAEVIAGVSERSGVDRETCEKVLNAFEAVFQGELSAKGLTGAFGKLAWILNCLSGNGKGKSPS